MVLFSASNSGPLFDMQFDEGAEFPNAHRFIAAITDAVERFADADAGQILAAENIAGGVFAGIGRRGHGGRREARTFLVGPVADAERGFRLDVRRH